MAGYFGSYRWILSFEVDESRELDLDREFDLSAQHQHFLAYIFGLSSETVGHKLHFEGGQAFYGAHAIIKSSPAFQAQGRACKRGGLLEFSSVPQYVSSGIKTGRKTLDLVSSSVLDNFSGKKIAQNDLILTALTLLSELPGLKIGRKDLSIVVGSSSLISGVKNAISPPWKIIGVPKFLFESVQTRDIITLIRLEGILYSQLELSGILAGGQLGLSLDHHLNLERSLEENQEFDLDGFSKIFFIYLFGWDFAPVGYYISLEGELGVEEVLGGKLGVS